MVHVMETGTHTELNTSSLLKETTPAKNGLGKTKIRHDTVPLLHLKSPHQETDTQKAKPQSLCSTLILSFLSNW